MSKVVDKTGKLDALAVTLEQFAGKRTVAPASLPVHAAQALRNLRNTGRDFLSETSEMKAAIVAAVRASLKGGRIDAAEWDRVAAEAVQRHVVGRFDAQGGDVSLAPLSPIYRAHKAMMGWDPRIGIARGLLVKALAGARWVVRKG